MFYYAMLLFIIISLSIGECCVITIHFDGSNVLLKNMEMHHKLLDKYFHVRFENLNL